MSRNKGSLIVFTGPSGVGKGTVLQLLREWGTEFFFSVSATTRSPRPGEIPGVSYLYMTNEAYEQMVAENAFLEHARFAGNGYGTPKAPVMEALEAGKDVILEIDVQGAMQVKASYPEAVTVFLLPPSMEDLEKRLRGRNTETEEQIQKRISAAAGECAQADRFMYHIISDVPELAARRLQSIMTAERCRNQNVK